ncbi:hypothetical protein [Paenibacillus andongensis]|uniref:hypothetical protein n=1 Tax=Paenibacillus andongensis TaxID=2975482 RepID=UPI0021BA4EA1|nr:hypothetical protein [Paenibacillus andongensis]
MKSISFSPHKSNRTSVGAWESKIHNCRGFLQIDQKTGAISFNPECYAFGSSYRSGSYIRMVGIEERREVRRDLPKFRI